MKYPMLFSPGKIGNLNLKNRIVMPAQEMLAAGFNGEMSDDLIAYYEKRAKAGCALIITAYASVDDEFSQSFAGAQLKITDPRHTSGFSKLARTLHKYDARVLVQIYLGDSAELGTRTPDKNVLSWLLDYYETQVKKFNIQVMFNTTATVEMIVAMNPYAVFVASGSTPIIPPVEGVGSDSVHTVEEALQSDFRPNGQKIVVIGGGMTGCEVAENFAVRGNQVTLVEMLDQLAPEVCKDNLVTVLKNLNERGARILLGHKMLRLAPGQVLAENLADGREVTIDCDHVILSLGNRPNDEIFRRLAGKLDRVIQVGDSLAVGRIAQAVQTGFERAYVMQ